MYGTLLNWYSTTKVMLVYIHKIAMSCGLDKSSFAWEMSFRVPSQFRVWLISKWMFNLDLDFAIVVNPFIFLGSTQIILYKSFGEIFSMKQKLGSLNWVRNIFARINVFWYVFSCYDHNVFSKIQISLYFIFSLVMIFEVFT